MSTANINKSPHFPGVKDGETFSIGGLEFIKFPSKNGQTPAVMKDIAFFSQFGGSNNLAESEVLKRMKSEILPRIIAEVGEDNLCTFKTDLTTLCGLKPYGELESRISLPTLDFYRANADIFDKHKPNRWWWLATPESAMPHYDPYWVLCVSPSGYFNYDFFIYDRGVRPFLIFKSSIFESSEA